MSVVYKQIPNMPLAIALAGPEEFEVVQAGVSKRTSIDKVTALVVTQVAGSPASPIGPAGGDLAGFYPNPQLKPSSTNGQVMTTLAGIAIWATPPPSGGSVTSVSVVSVNGLTGTVATPTTTPQISLSTTVTGMLKGNGTAILAAIAGTDFVTPGGLPTSLPPSGAAGGDLKNTYPNPLIKPSVTNGQLMTTVAGVAVWAAPPSTTPSGVAGGDLAGTYPNPTIKADVALTGNPTAPTPTAGDNDTSIATTAFVTAAVAASPSGTVTSVSVANVNGLNGTVANPTTTPVISLSTTISGMLKGNGTAISAGVAGTDYVTPGGLPTTLPPSGAAGGALTGTYPDPTLVGGPLSLYAPLASPVFTGDPTAPSPAAGDADFSIPTTAWVQGELAAIAPGGATLTGYWNYSSAALVPPPASGRVRLSVAWPPTLSSSMHLYIASTDIDGYTYTWALGPAVNNILVFRSASGGRAQLLVTATSIQSGYIDVTATVQQVSGNNVNNSRCQISILANSYSPSGAAGGDLTGTYPNPTIKPSVINGEVMTTVAGVAAWAAASGGAATFVGTTPPGSPTDGQLWYYSDAVTGGGTLYIRYNDGNTTQWVPASPAQSIVAPTVVVVTAFTAGGTWTPNAKMVYARIRALGAGGAGGSVAAAAATLCNGTCGGGAGSLSETWVSKATAGASQTVTIGAAGSPGAAGNNPGGAGGDTSVGTLCVGKGGSGGLGMAATPGLPAMALGGVAGTGDETSTGMPGGGGATTVGNAIYSGSGGSSLWGGGGRGVADAVGSAGSGWGSGGSGACCFNPAAARAGGAGTAGKVVIIEYCTA